MALDCTKIAESRIGIFYADSSVVLFAGVAHEHSVRNLKDPDAAETWAEAAKDRPVPQTHASSRTSATPVTGSA